MSTRVTLFTDSGSNVTSVPDRGGSETAQTPRRRTNAAVARELVLTPGAVEKPICSIFAKLDLPATDADHRRVLRVLASLGATGR